MVPGQRWLCPSEQPYGSVGSIGTRVRSATAVQSLSASTASTPQPRCGPCCSVAPTGNSTAFCTAARSPGSSAQVRCDQNIALLHVVCDVGHAAHDGIFLLISSLIMPPAVDQLLEPRLGSEERCRYDLCKAARPRHRHLDQLLDLPRMRRQHQDAIVQENRLVQVVRDEHNGDIDLAPDLQQVGLHAAACLGIERAERL